MEASDLTAGRALLRERVGRIPARLRAFLQEPAEPLPIDPSSVRCFVTTGAGGSEAHARFLAHLLSVELHLPARYTPLSSFVAGPPAGAERDVLVVFSQGLSPNARLALEHPRGWAHVVLATAVTDEGARRVGHEAQQRVLQRLRDGGGLVARFPEEDEGATLVRVIGAMTGYVCALRLASTLGARCTPPRAAPAIDAGALHAELAASGPRLDAAIDGLDLRTLPDELAFLTSGDYGELTANLRYKVLEGMLAPLPPVWDLLHFAHGPFQQIYDRRAVFVALCRPDAPREAELLERLSTMLVPARHTLVRLPARLPGVHALFEHEALLDQLLLRCVEARGIDPVRWPGRGLDGPLYDLGSE